MKKILIISPVAFYPPDEGNKSRIFSMIKNLKKKAYNIHFLCTLENLEYRSIEKMTNYVDAFYSVCYDKTETTIFNYFSKVKKVLKLKYAYYYKKITGYHHIDSFFKFEIETKLREIKEKNSFDIVLVEYIFLSKALNYFDENTIKIIDTHDVFYKRCQLFKDRGIKQSWFCTNKKNETIALNRADKIIAIQNNEKKLFEELVNKQIVVIGHDINLPEKVMTIPEGNEIKYLLFIGSQNKINQSAISYYISKIYPKLKNKYEANFKLLLVGRICDYVEDDVDIVKLGVVELLADCYQKADLIINPVQFGTGLKIKNIEALAYSKPLITTTVGAEGIEDGSNRAFLVCDTDDEFVDSIIAIFKNKNYQLQIQNEARSFIQKYMENNTANYENLFK
jgi:glycosyltransferase involved in cell wall biosynthesis